MTERLSRLIDGDLGAAEKEALAAILESDPLLRRELDGLTRVRASLRSLADRENPPAKLDALVDPLLQGKPEPAFGRPWARWLATAAAVVLGVTVVLEVQRRQPDSSIAGWQERALDGGAGEPTPGFALAPLPTSSVPADQQPLGAADRLVSAPEPEINPPLDPAPALEVMGPLDAAERSRDENSGRQDHDDATADLQGQRRAGRSATEQSEVAEKSRAASLPADESALTDTTGGTTTLPRGQSSDRGDATAKNAPISGAQLFVFMEAETAWRGFEPDGPSEAGRYALRIRVEGGVVREVWPVANPPAPTRQVRASQLVLGLEVDNVPDGEYAAEVVVEPRRLFNP